MISQIITAFILGLVGGIVPGPVLAATFTEILQSGFSKSLRIIFWAMLTETTVAFVSLIALSSLGLSPSFFYALSFVGAGILIWIATQLWKIKSLDLGEKVSFGPGKIAAMILANGVLWTFWITVCIPKAIALDHQIHYGQFIFLVLVEIGWLISTVGVALAFSWFRGILSNPRAIPLMFKGFALIFAYFALSMIYGSTTFFATGLTAATAPTTITDPTTLPGLQVGKALWIPEIDNLGARLAVDNLPRLTMEGTVLHIHQHLDLYVNGEPIAVPALVGINENAGWLSPIHVHDTTGIIHVESPYLATFTLGEFFDVWGVKFTKTAIGGYTTDTTHSLRVYVNGQLYQDDPRMLPLAAHQEIVVVYGTDTQIPKNIPASYTFPSGY